MLTEVCRGEITSDKVPNLTHISPMSVPWHGLPLSARVLLNAIGIHSSLSHSSLLRSLVGLCGMETDE